MEDNGVLKEVCQFLPDFLLELRKDADDCIDLYVRNANLALEGSGHTVDGLVVNMESFIEMDIFKFTEKLGLPPRLKLQRHDSFAGLSHLLAEIDGRLPSDSPFAYFTRAQRFHGLAVWASRTAKSYLSDEKIGRRESSSHFGFEDAIRRLALARYAHYWAYIFEQAPGTTGG